MASTNPPTNTPSPTEVAPDRHDLSQPIELAKLEPGDIQKLQVDDQSKATTATPLHFAKPDVNVIWINGLDYLPNVPGEGQAAQAPAASPTAAPTATAKP